VARKRRLHHRKWAGGPGIDSVCFDHSPRLILKTAVAHRHPWPASRFGASETFCFVIKARLQSGRKVLNEKLGFIPCKTSAWQNTMIRLLLDPRFSNAPQLAKMVRSSITARDFTLKKIVNSRLDRLPFLE
jgi:hypothetical protein